MKKFPSVVKPGYYVGRVVRLLDTDTRELLVFDGPYPTDSRAVAAIEDGGESVIRILPRDWGKKPSRGSK